MAIMSRARSRAPEAEDREDVAQNEERISVIAKIAGSNRPRRSRPRLDDGYGERREHDGAAFPTPCCQSTSPAEFVLFGGNRACSDEETPPWKHRLIPAGDLTKTFFAGSTSSA
jgi:hypothetical protein